MKPMPNSYRVGDYIPADYRNTVYADGHYVLGIYPEAMSLDAAWERRHSCELWTQIVQTGDLFSAFCDLWKTNKDSAWSDIEVFLYTQVNL